MILSNDLKIKLRQRLRIKFVANVLLDSLLVQAKIA